MKPDNSSSDDEDYINLPLTVAQPAAGEQQRSQTD